MTKKKKRIIIISIARLCILVTASECEAVQFSSNYWIATLGFALFAMTGEFLD